MVKMKYFTVRKYLFFLFVSFACANVGAQTEDGAIDTLYEEEYYDSGIYLNLIDFNITNQYPMSTFSKNAGGTSLGISFAYYNNFRDKDDLFWGLHYSNFRISRLSNRYNVRDQFADYELFGKTKTSLIYFAYGLRYYPDLYSEKFEPFIDVKMGPNFVYTFTSNTIAGSEDSDLNFNNSDVSFGYAMGLGIQYNVRLGQALHFIVNYHGGTSATYYINQDKGLTIPLDNFERRTTQLDYLQIAFGLTFGF